MVRLRVLEILQEQNHTKYWLFKQMDLSMHISCFQSVRENKKMYCPALSYTGRTVLKSLCLWKRRIQGIVGRLFDKAGKPRSNLLI